MKYSCSGTWTMSLKTASQSVRTSNYSGNLRHQNHNLLVLFYYVEELARKRGERNVGTIKNEKQSSGSGSRRHETHNSCSMSWAPKRRISGSHAVKCDTSCCKVIFLWTKRVSVLFHVTHPTKHIAWFTLNRITVASPVFHKCVPFNILKHVSWSILLSVHTRVFPTHAPKNSSEVFSNPNVHMKFCNWGLILDLWSNNLTHGL